MSGPSTDEEDIKKCLKKLLDDGNVEELKAIMKDNLYRTALEKNGCELIGFVSQYITKRNLTESPAVFEWCEKLVYELATGDCADDVLLELIEQAEDCDSGRFVVMMRAMTACVEAIAEGTRAMALHWVMNTALRHVYDLPVPDDAKLEGDERLLADDNFDVGDVYRVVIDFYARWIDEIESSDFREKALQSLLKLFGKPLVYADLEERATKSDARLQAEGLVVLVLRLKADCLSLLGEVEECGLGSDDSCQTFLEADYVRTALAGFFYLVLHEGVGSEHSPQVYRPLFVLENVLRLSSVLLSYSHSVVQRKGLLLSCTVLDRIADRSVPYETVDHKLYTEYVEAVTGIMVYSEVKDNRQVAVVVFRKMLYKFDSKGRYVILLNVQRVMGQPGFVGYLATIAKDMVSDTLGPLSPPSDRQFFTGKRLKDLVFKFCRLEQGVKSDLIEYSDQVVSGLNLLRFLVIRDTANETGVWDYIDALKAVYLEPLKQGVVLSRAHYNLQKRDTREEVCDSKISVRIGELNLPQMPKEQKIQVLDSALNTFDLIESLLGRLNECIELNRK